MYLRNLLGSQIDETDYIPPWWRRSILHAIVWAGIYVIPQHCLQQYLFDLCDGIQAKQQDAHSCMSWTQRDIARVTVLTCEKHNLQGGEGVCCYCNCLLFAVSGSHSWTASLNTDHQNRSICTHQESLRKTLETPDHRILYPVECLIKDRDYKMLLVRKV